MELAKLYKQKRETCMGMDSKEEGMQFQTRMN